MYFPLLILHSWGKRSAAQPQTIYSEIPKKLPGAFSTREILQAVFISCGGTLWVYPPELGEFYWGNENGEGRK